MKAFPVAFMLAFAAAGASAEERAGPFGVNVLRRLTPPSGTA